MIFSKNIYKFYKLFFSLFVGILLNFHTYAYFDLNFDSSFILIPSSPYKIIHDKDELKNVLSHTNGKNFVHFGFSDQTTFYIEKLLPPKSQLIVIHPFTNPLNYEVKLNPTQWDQFNSNIQYAGLSSRIIPWNLSYEAGVQKLILQEQKIDFIYLDIQYYLNLKEFLESIFPLLSDQGILCGYRFGQSTGGKGLIIEEFFKTLSLKCSKIPNPQDINRYSFWYVNKKNLINLKWWKFESYETLEYHHHSVELNQCLKKCKFETIVLKNFLDDDVDIDYLINLKGYESDQSLVLKNKSEHVFSLKENEYVSHLYLKKINHYYFNVEHIDSNKIILLLETKSKPLFPLPRDNPDFLKKNQNDTRPVFADNPKDGEDDYAYKRIFNEMTSFWNQADNQKVLFNELKKIMLDQNNMEHESKIEVNHEVIYTKFDEVFQKNYPLMFNCEKLDVYKIEQNLHFIWLSDPKFPKEMPLKCAQCLLDTMKVHPSREGWKVMLWITDKNFTPYTVMHPLLELDKDLEKQIEIHEVKEFQNSTYLKHAKQIMSDDMDFGGLSDIARIEAVDRYGGNYSDSDYFFIQSIKYFHQTYECYVGLENEWSICNATFGAKKGSPFLKLCMALIKIHFDPELMPSYMKKYSSYKILRTVIGTGPTLFTLAYYLSQQFLNENIILPREFLFIHGDVKDKFIPLTEHTFKYPPYTVGKHYWDSSWIKILKLDKNFKD